MPSDLNFNFSGAQNSNNFYEAVNEITSTAQIGSANTITYRAGTYVQMNPGFTATPNSSNSFYAFIHPCSYDGNSPRIRSANETSSLGSFFETEEEEMEENGIKIFPNPTSGKFTVLGKDDDVFDVQVYNIIGELVYQIKSVKEKTEIDISSFNSGVYTVKIMGKNVNRTSKIIRE